MLLDFFSQSLSLLGSFNIYVAAYLFLVCSIPEAIGLSIPYLLETTWLLAGYQFSSGVLSFSNLFLYVLIAIAGREAGAVALYQLSAAGSRLITRYFSRFMPKPDNNKNNGSRFKLLQRLDFLSPFSVAIGRLVWLRIPTTIVLGAKGRLKTLIISVVISSLIWDGTYIALGGVAGRTFTAKPYLLALFFLAAVATSYLISLLIRFFVRIFLKRKPLNPGGSGPN